MLAAAAAGCSELPAQALGPGSESGSSSSGDGTTTSADDSPTPTTLTEVDTSGSSSSGDPSTTTTDDGGSSSSDGSSGEDSSSGETGEPMPACSDGIPVAGEQCHQQGPAIVVDPAPMSVAWGDLNGDGPVDVVLTNPASTHVTVLYGVGDGNFVAPQTLVDVGTMIDDVVLEDFSGDGVPDLVVTDSANDQVISHANDGMGGLFFAGQYPVAINPLRLNTGLIDGDAIPDLVVLASNGMQMLSGNGLGGFLAGETKTIPNGPPHAELLDLNGDGLLDLLTVNQGSHNASTFLNVGGMFEDGVNHNTANTPLGVATGDVNSDGALDLAVVHASTDRVGILLGDGAGDLGSEDQVVIDDDPRAVALADLDLDGRLDLITAHTTPDLVAIHRGLGDGTFEPPDPTFDLNAPSGLWVVDVNADGVEDVIVGRLADLSLQVLLSDP